MGKTKEAQQINFEKIVESKNPKLLKWVPNSILEYIKRIVHLEEFNDFLYLSRNDFEHDFVTTAIKHFQVNVISRGLENIPKQGGCILVCNHPLGGLDGIAVMGEVAKVRMDIKALVNDILMNLNNLSNLLVPTNKHAKNGIENIKKINQAYASNECIIVFPAGLVSRKQNGVIKDLEWKKSFITKAVQHKHNVIPVYIAAQNSNFFYNLALFRKTIGIKANIEMFYLVDEVYKQKGKTISITVGEPISYETFTKKRTDYYWAEMVKEHVYGFSNGKR